MMRILVLLIALGSAAAGATVVGIRGSQFTINGQPTYTAAQGFPHANANLAGTLLNIRAVQAIFDDANYPGRGSRGNPYPAHTMDDGIWDYPDGPYSAERNLREFLEALPQWRKCGILAFTVNLQGGGPVDGNFGENAPMQPHVNTGFNARGELQEPYQRRLQKVLAEADRLGMVVIVGLFYQGENARIDTAPNDEFIRTAITQTMRWLKSLPHRNVLVEIQNEVGVRGYRHPLLRPEGVAEAIALAQKEGGGQFPVSVSWLAGLRERSALQQADYILFHTNGRTPEAVHEEIIAFRKLAGYEKPMLINEDGVSPFNLQAAVQERVGWGYYDQGTSNYKDGFQSPPVNWGISSPVKWLFFEQVARLTGSPAPPRPEGYSNMEAPRINVIGLGAGQVVDEALWIEAIVEDRHSRWPIKRVEFYLDGKPYHYRRNAPFLLGSDEWWDPRDLAPGAHVLRVVAYDMRGPRFSETAAIVEIEFGKR
jgi:hypothetical protein